jgi:hypothetical protein
MIYSQLVLLNKSNIVLASPLTTHITGQLKVLASARCFAGLMEKRLEYGGNLIQKCPGGCPCTIFREFFGTGSGNHDNVLLSWSKVFEDPSNDISRLGNSFMNGRDE